MFDRNYLPEAHMRKAASRGAIPLVEVLEGRELLSVSPSLAGQQTFPTRTVLTVDAGTLGQAITCNVTVCCAVAPIGAIGLSPHGTLFQATGKERVPSPFPQFPTAYDLTYALPAGVPGARVFGVGLHAVRATFGGTKGATFSSTSVAVFRIQRPQFVTQPSGVGTATLDAGSGPALKPGQTATVQYTAYFAAGYRPFYSTESHTPDTQSFIVDADPEQVIPGLDAGVAGMQAGETRAIYIPRSLSRGVRGSLPAIQPRANLVYLVTLVSIT